MQRRLNDLTDRQFDVLIVGGGICGLTIACDAAQRGLSVALIERHDFGSGTSFNHLRTIHGGLRYLQHLDLARARTSIRERRALAIIAPWALQPTPFVLPLDRSLTKGPLAMRAGFLLDRLMASDRNRGVLTSHALPGGAVVSADAAHERFPAARGLAMSAAAVWFDFVTTDADRLTFAWAQAAARYGAVLANYVRAERWILENGRVIGAEAVDQRTGSAMTIRARTLVNATGASLDALLPSEIAASVPMTMAMNLVTDLEVPPAAIGGRLRSGRNLFMVPWQGRALFGTWESGLDHRHGDLSIKAADVVAFVDDIATAYPSLPLRPEQVTFVHRGLVPATRTADGSYTPDGHEHVHDHARAGHPEIISVAGTKYTTARAVAEQVTTRLFAVLGKPPVPCRTATTPLPAPQGDLRTRLIEAARNEMVVTLEDAVIRRTTLGALGPPSEAALLDAATVVGNELGWDEARQRTELANLREFYEGRRPR